MIQWLAVFICFLLCWWLTSSINKGLLCRRLLDVPSARSSHVSPTATAGGLGMLISFSVFLVWFYFTNNSIEKIHILLMCIGSLAGFIGYLDDCYNLKVSWRFVLHILLAVIVVMVLSPLPELQLLGWKFEPSLWLAIFYILALVWFMNLYNFMDGIDGLAGSEAITTLLGAILIIGLSGSYDWLAPLAALVASVLGFLIFNWSPAKLFMGDVGSFFLGSTIGVLVLLTSVNGSMSILSWSILLALFVSDATITLIRRLVGGECIYKAHSSHSYQVLARYWSSHSKVTVLAIAINVVWLWPLAWCAVEYNYIATEIAFIAYAPLLLTMYFVGKKKKV